MTVSIDKNPAIKSHRHPLDELCINTIRTLAIDAIQAANSGHPERPWQWRRSAITSGNTCSTSTLRTRSGRTGTASCSRPATLRCCFSAAHLSGSGPSARTTSGWASRRFPSMRSRPSGSGIAAGPGLRSTAGPRASRRRRGRSGRVWPTASAWRWQVAGWPHATTGLASKTDRLQRLRPLRRRLHDGGYLFRGRLARRALEALQPLLDLRQQPRHDRGEHCAGFQRGRRARFWATAGTSHGWEMPTISTCSTCFQSIPGRDTIGRP